MNYEEKITLLNGDDFFSFFEYMHAQPRWVNSNGKRSIQVLGLCHHGENHSALFDPIDNKNAQLHRSWAFFYLQRRVLSRAMARARAALEW